MIVSYKIKINQVEFWMQNAEVAQPAPQAYTLTYVEEAGKRLTKFCAKMQLGEAKK
jgi:hypothetical protein